MRLSLLASTVLGQTEYSQLGSVASNTICRLKEASPMTEMLDVNLEEALARIDEGLVVLSARELMSASEVSDMLLDLRLLLMVAASDAPVAAGAPVAVEPASLTS